MLVLALSILLVLIVLLAERAILRRKIHIWLPSYCTDSLRKSLGTPGKSKTDRPTHVLFCFVDHFEPGWNKAGPESQRMRVDAWLDRYPLMAGEFLDADGFHPRHTWFYPPHYFKDEHVSKLLNLCKRGFGEIEMHLHHSRMEPFPDTAETLRKKIRDCIALYSSYGIFETAVDGVPQNKYAFIHGDWALDNSRSAYCGVNDEITILKETGCYADFTFPSYMMESQPRMVNAIYYAHDDPHRPKSYEKGTRVRAGSPGTGDLMMIQGPLVLRWKKRKWFYVPAVEDGEIAGNNPPSDRRVDSWIKAGIHVSGREDWVVVKAFTHGAPESGHDVLLGEPIRNMHKHLRQAYNDGTRYVLHYVTARELYNIIRAAEDGERGNPGRFRDYVIKSYRYA